MIFSSCVLGNKKCSYKIEYRISVRVLNEKCCICYELFHATVALLYVAVCWVVCVGIGVKTTVWNYTQLLVCPFVAFVVVYFAVFLLFTALHICRAVFATGNVSIRLSVRPSVCLSHAWIVTKRKHLAKKVQLWLIGSPLRAFQWA